MTARRKDAVERMLSVATAYADPTSPSAGNATASYKLVVPDATPETAKKQAKRYLKDPVFQNKVMEVQKAIQLVAAMTPEEFAKKGLEIAEDLLERKGIGDAAAAAKFFEAAGKAMGFFVTRIKDETPSEKKALDAAAVYRSLREAMTTFEAINEPNPLPEITAKAETKAETEEADYEVVDGE